MNQINFYGVSNMNHPTSRIAIAGLADAFKFGAATILVLGICALSACNHPEAQTQAPANCLTDIKLVDQSGSNVSLASLKGKPMLVDFIYTTCPGPCLMETAKFANVALRLGDKLGSKVTLVSITVDPEHDGPKQLLQYSQQQGADAKGWYFLTGSPADIDRALAGFKIIREKEPDGSVGHVVSMVLVNGDGAKVHEYSGEVVKAQTLTTDLLNLSNG
jgi:protein SCO1